MSRKNVIEIISLLMMFLFVYASVAKLLDIEKFRIQIGQSPLLADIAGFTSWFIPAVELIVSVLLVVPQLRLWGLLGSFGLMTLFTAYIVSVLQLSEQIPCACGGVLQTLGWTEHLIFNVAFSLASGVGIILQSKERNTNRQVAC